MIARGRNINVTLIFSLERHKEVAEAYIRGLERLAEAGGDPVEGRLGRQLLRLARRHRSRPAARRGRASRAEGEARRREREARVPELQGDLLRRALGRARREGRDAAVVPLGLDLDEEPRVPRRPLRRGADRPGHREHDAARDDRGVPGPRRGRAHARGRHRRGEAGLRAGRRRPASTTTTSPTRSSAKASRSSSTRSRSSSTASPPSAASSQPRERSVRGAGRCRGRRSCCVHEGIADSRMWEPQWAAVRRALSSRPLRHARLRPVAARGRDVLAGRRPGRAAREPRAGAGHARRRLARRVRRDGDGHRTARTSSRASCSSLRASGASR